MTQVKLIFRGAWVVTRSRGRPSYLGIIILTSTYYYLVPRYDAVSRLARPSGWVLWVVFC